jgi:hypothetical protein
MVEDLVQRHEMAARLDEARSENVPEIIDQKSHAGVLANTVML